MSEVKPCQNCKQNFTIIPEDFVFYEKMKVPAPTWCPECRLQRRLCWRNESTLYKRKCMAPGHTEDIVSIFSPDKPHVVYCQKYWWSDNWDKGGVSLDYDFSRPFFEQFRELTQKAPIPALSSNYTTMVNSEYSNWAGDLRNCYLVVDADYVENSAYGSGWVHDKECMDCDNIRHCELCYDSFDLEKCYRTVGSVSCKDSTDLYFSKNCSGCSNCFGCMNLRKQKYCIFNEQYEKDTYEAKLKEFRIDTHEGYRQMRESVKEFWMRFPEKSFHGAQNVNSTGDYLYHCKNVKNGFLITDVEDSKFIALTHSKPTKDCYDYTDWGENATLVYDSIGVGLGVNNIKFSQLTGHNAKNIEYSSLFCWNCSDCFGCSGIAFKQYRILNKQYEKDEYFTMVEKIKKHMDGMPYIDKAGRMYKYGEFFPQEIAPWAYNETVAQEYFPLTKQGAEEKKFTWRDPDPRNYVVTLQPSEVPNEISAVTDEILKQTIACEHVALPPAGVCNHKCTEALRIIPQELAFYRQMSLPLPRLCPNCRHYVRLRNRNSLKLWHRKCMKSGCNNEFETTFSPDSPEIIYCESCYQNEVV